MSEYFNFEQGISQLQQVLQQEMALRDRRRYELQFDFYLGELVNDHHACLFDVLLWFDDYQRKKEYGNC